MQWLHSGRVRAAVLVALLGPLGWFALANAINMSLEKRAPQVLMRLTPGSPAALNAQAQVLLLRKPKPDDDGARALLERSLVARPLDGFGLRLYGIASGGMEYSPKGEPYFRLSERVSRRDVATELYLILADAKKERIRPALRRLERTLRASATSRDQLFPVLAQLIGRADGREIFADIVQPDSPWLADFLTFAIDSRTEPRSVALAAASVGGFPDTAGRAQFEQALVRALDSQADYRTLAQLLPRLHALPRGLATTAALDAKRTDDGWQPLSWQTSESPAISAYPLTSAGGSAALSVSMGGGVRGRVARKLLRLAPGTYQLAIRQNFDEPEDTGLNAASALPEWTVSCMDRDPPKVLLALTGQVAAPWGTFTVSRKCPFVQVALYVRSPDAAATATMLVEQVSVRRLARR